MLTGNAKACINVDFSALQQCGAARLLPPYDALLDYERADWPALAAAAARLGPIESLIPDCYTSAAQRSATLAS